MSIDPIEVLALKKIAIICGALAERFEDRRAASEQKALTMVLINVIARAELDNAKREGAAI